MEEHDLSDDDFQVSAEWGQYLVEAQARMAEKRAKRRAEKMRASHRANTPSNKTYPSKQKKGAGAGGCKSGARRPAADQAGERGASTRRQHESDAGADADAGAGASAAAAAVAAAAAAAPVNYGSSETASRVVMLEMQLNGKFDHLQHSAVPTPPVWPATPLRHE
jgi:hypothetical protein